ncbi:MAG: hypothetical protein EOP86_08800 [Verrucomicrobiaceae bacterium]|nr:MAG: hypothetical protein EOP86_08800 [Verrucomicrobiaceae bacterium]
MDDSSAGEFQWSPDDREGGNHPSYRTIQGILASRGEWYEGKPRPAAVAFQPADAGLHSWSGRILCDGPAAWHTATVLIFGKLSSEGQWVDQWETKVAHGATLDLATVPGLRSMPVKNGERMVMVVMPAVSSGSSGAHLTVPGHELTITRVGPVNAVPDFSSVGSNPNHQFPEGEWSLREITEEHTGSAANFQNYRLMKWNDAGACWQGGEPLNQGGHPGYRPGSSALSSAGPGSTPAHERRSAMVFKSWRPGFYEMTGILECGNGNRDGVSGGSASTQATRITMIRFTQEEPGTYIPDELYQEDVPETLPTRRRIDLGTKPPLRAILLNSGDMLAIVVSSPAGVARGAYFNPVAGNPVSIDRLPASHNVFTDTPGDSGENPARDTAGNQWEAGQLPALPATAAGFYHPMTWNPAINVYQGGALINNTPTWHPSTAVLTSSRSAGAGAVGMPYLRFTPARAGVYSWSGQFQIDNRLPPSRPAGGYVAFGRIDDNGTRYQELARWTFSGAVAADAESIAGLDQITLKAGDSLTLHVVPDDNTSFGLRMRSPLGNVMIQPGARNRPGSTVIDVPHGMPAAETTTGTVNPSQDEEGNQWRVYQIPGGDPAAVSSYVPMVWDSAAHHSGKGRWRGTAMTAGGPGWYPADFALNSARDGTSPGGVASLVFTPAKAGTYSWRGTVQIADWGWSGVGGKGNIRFGKISGTAYTGLHAESFTPAQAAREFDLSGIPALQGVTLAAGESLTISLHPGTNSSPALRLNLPRVKNNRLFIRSVVGGATTLLPVSTRMPDASGPNPRPGPVAGEEWRAFKVRDCTADPVAAIADPSKYEGLTWSSPQGKWTTAANAVAGPYPIWWPAQDVMGAARSTASRYYGISGLSFKAGAAGVYAWEGKIKLNNWSGFSSTACLVFGKLSRSGSCTVLGKQLFPMPPHGSTTIDMRELSFLTPVTLRKDDGLILALAPGEEALAPGQTDRVVATELSADTGPRPLLIEKVRHASPADSSDLSRPHLIDVSAEGVPFDRGLLGQAGGLKRLPKPGETPGGAPSFATGILVRGPVAAAESWFTQAAPATPSHPAISSTVTTWKSGLNPDPAKPGYYWARTVLNFMRNLKAAGCVPLLGVDAGRLHYPLLTEPSQVLSQDNIRELAELAGDYVRYVNYTIRHFTVENPPSLMADPRDYNLLRTVAGGLEDKLPRASDTVTDCVTYWEVGNEPDHRTAVNYNYGDAYQAIGDRMRAVNAEIKSLDPSIPDLKIGPALGSGDYWSLRPRTMEIFKPGYAGQIDFIAIHPYDSLQKVLVPMRHLVLASPPASPLQLRNAGQEMEAGLRSLRSPAGAVFSLRDGLVDEYITRMGRARKNLEILATEYDPMSHAQIWAPAGRFAGQLPQMTLYNVLANMETLFILRDRGYNGACWWYHDVNAPVTGDPTGGRDTAVAPLKLYQKLNAHLGDKVIYQYAPVAYHGADSGDGVRIYATRNTATGKLSIWCGNLWQERPARVRLGIRGPAASASSATVERLAGVGTTGLGSRFLTWNTTSQPHAVDWSEPQSVPISELSDFELDLPPATITLLLVNP